MIVDDSAMSRRIMKDILSSGGHAVIESDEGMAALEMYFLQKPDLVMLDLIMRGMYGLEVLKKIKEIDNNARVIVASADIQSSTRQLARDGGAIGFINKPFAREDVLAAVETALKATDNASH